MILQCSSPGFSPVRNPRVPKKGRLLLESNRLGGGGCFGGGREGGKCGCAAVRPPSTECPPPPPPAFFPIPVLPGEPWGKKGKEREKEKKGGGKKIASKQMIAPPPRVPRGEGGFTAGGVGRATEGAALGGGVSSAAFRFSLPHVWCLFPILLGEGGEGRGGRGCFAVFSLFYPFFPLQMTVQSGGGIPKGSSFPCWWGGGRGGQKG